MFLQSTSFTIFDVETTGLNPHAGDRIVEIAAVRIEGGAVDRAHPFFSLVNPERKVSFGARLVNRIPEEELHAAPSITEVLPKFLDFSQQSILIAHNAEFDLLFLREEKELCWGYVDIPECLCTLSLSRALFPTLKQHSLPVVAERLKISRPPLQHRALPDVLLTAQVFLTLIEYGGIQSLEKLRKLAAPKAAPVA